MRTGAQRGGVYGGHIMSTHPRRLVSEYAEEPDPRAKTRKTNPIRFTPVDIGLPQLTSVDAFLEIAKRTHRSPNPRERAAWALRTPMMSRDSSGAQYAKRTHRHLASCPATPPAGNFIRDEPSPRPEPVRSDFWQGIARRGPAATKLLSPRCIPGRAAPVSTLGVEHHVGSALGRQRRRPARAAATAAGVLLFRVLLDVLRRGDGADRAGADVHSHQRRAAGQDAARPAADPDHRLADRLGE